MTIPIRVMPNWSPADRGDTYHYSTTTLAVFWPRAEHEKLIARWPHLAAAEVGSTWDEHRQQVERHETDTFATSTVICPTRFRS